MTLWMVFYTHKHGHDHFVFKTEKDADKCALKIAKDEAKNMGVTSYEDSELIFNWPEITDGEENIEVSQVEVYESYREWAKK